jgi:hypothetical protein
MLCPTAQMSVADRASTENSSLKNPGLGLVATVHAVPSQCSASVRQPIGQGFVSFAGPRVAGSHGYG